MKKFALLPILTFFTLSIFAADEWKIKEDGVSISIFDNKFKGSFDNLSGTIIFSPDDLENSTFDVVINAPEIKVDGSGMQEKHVKSDNWLNVEEFPEITFKSYKIEKTADGFLVKGDLTIHGINQDAAIPFTFTETEDGGVFEGKFILGRKDYEIGPNGSTVETVEISIKVEVTK